ncbi:hypothetical protein [Pseudonocardia halophobica]|uniref:hypothetical protein n=1 Tax=Pseudonocardia halophobica TaxID=29401 RepID=UPI0031CF2EB1
MRVPGDLQVDARPRSPVAHHRLVGEQHDRHRGVAAGEGAVEVETVPGNARRGGRAVVAAGEVERRRAPPRPVDQRPEVDVGDGGDREAVERGIEPVEHDLAPLRP